MTDVPADASPVAAPPRQRMSPRGSHRAGTAGYLADDLRLGQTRAARLIVTPPRDVSPARVQVKLSPGLHFSNQVPDGGQADTQTVWRGAARKDQPIEVSLFLVGVTTGMQMMQVMLMEDAPKDEATIVAIQTLPVNVLAR
jgi:hypothetical protein